MTVNCLQRAKGNVIEVRFELLDARLGQRDFSRLQSGSLLNAQTIDQYVRTRIAILRVLAGAVFISHA